MKSICWKFNTELSDLLQSFQNTFFQFAEVLNYKEVSDFIVIQILKHSLTSIIDCRNIEQAIACLWQIWHSLIMLYKFLHIVKNTYCNWLIYRAQTFLYLMIAVIFSSSFLYHSLSVRFSQSLFLSISLFIALYLAFSVGLLLPYCLFLSFSHSFTLYLPSNSLLPLFSLSLPLFIVIVAIAHETENWVFFVM